MICFVSFSPCFALFLSLRALLCFFLSVLCFVSFSPCFALFLSLRAFVFPLRHARLSHKNNSLSQSLFPPAYLSVSLPFYLSLSHLFTSAVLNLSTSLFSHLLTSLFPTFVTLLFSTCLPLFSPLAHLSVFPPLCLSVSHLPTSVVLYLLTSLFSHLSSSVVLHLLTSLFSHLLTSLFTTCSPHCFPTFLPLFSPPACLPPTNCQKADRTR